ncbi:hypothetical protein F4775DRAFT_196980 [Biscogniauxia sp. FL1348]|nr:hypothetical protein F4775DRAFT_196980 [Biscogniauxia sp. FL1348]
MSAQSSPSPRVVSPAVSVIHIDENKLPSGRCRYILLNPEIKGQRCACVGFTLNQDLPGVSCQCGHLSCYHIKAPEPPPDKSEVDELRRRIQALEGQLDRENQTGIGSALGGVVRRLGDLEEQVENNKEEAGQEMKDCYRNVNRVWQSIEQLERRQGFHENRFISYDERLDAQDDTLQRLGDRVAELDEASIALEERVEALEDSAIPETSFNPQRRGSTSEPEQSKNFEWTAAHRSRPSNHHVAALMRASPSRTHGPRRAIADDKVSEQMTAASWTVHVSLLPTASQPFPFEKDTNAYKRCLSRGLHQMLAVGGTDGESFSAAVSKAFGSLLRGRDWAPLQARLCDAATLQGLPMLRPLEPGLVGAKYDLEFLRKYCAVCSPNGKVESLYIAMLSDTFSWHFLRRSPCYLEGLEASWEYDALLDQVDDFEDDHARGEDRPSAGEIMPSFPTLKRTASEMTRTASFSSPSAGEGGEGSRAKLQRTACIQTPMELHRCGVETV